MNTYIHDISPFALQFTESFGIRWYGLSYLAGFLAQYFLIVWLSLKGLSPLTKALASDFVFIGALGTIIGGRLGYCILYAPELLSEFTSMPPFWGVLAINRGGMASHGGIVGIIIACIYFGKKHYMSALHLFDLCTLGGSIGIFFGRIANFINAELVGRPASESLAWAAKFPQDMYFWSSNKLIQLQNIIGLIGLNSDSWPATVQSSAYNPQSRALVEQTIGAIITAVQKGNSAVIENLSPLLLARHPSQLYAAFLEGLLLFCILFFVWRKPRKPGVIAGLFFSLYACVRIIGEQFRMPDPQIGFQIFGTTRGQLLSLGLLLFGLIVLIIWNKRDTEKIGGWYKN